MSSKYSIYESLLTELQNQGFTICLPGEQEPSTSGQTVFLRHDLDESIEDAFQMAMVEEQKGARAVYFLMLDTDAYNLYTAKNRKMLGQMTDMGHEFGLHFAPPDGLSKKDYESLIQKESRLLGGMLDLDIKSFCIHRPLTELLADELKVEGLENLYAKQYFGKDRYISDSNFNWRCGDPLEFIRNFRGDTLQLLTHPFWWSQSHRPAGEIFEAFVKNQEGRARDYLIENVKRAGEYFNPCYMKILIFGNISGVRQLVDFIPSKNIAGITAAVIRPKFHENIQSISGELNVPFRIQPRRNDQDYQSFCEWVREINPDLIWVHAYPMKLYSEILNIPRLGGLNIHGAPLPAYRGSNPTQWALLNNETESGVTLHEMSENFDEGAIVAQKLFPILFEETWVDVHNRMEQATAEMIQKVLPTILKGEWESRPQDESRASYFGRRKPEDGESHWDWPEVKIYNVIRALVKPHPGAFYINEKGERIVIDQFMSLDEVRKLKEKCLT